MVTNVGWLDDACGTLRRAIESRDGGTDPVAVKLRLVRMGKKKQPTYRVVAADSRSPRDGRFLEIVGTYAPRGTSMAEPDAVIRIDNAKALKWLRQGAQPTDRVERLLRSSGAWEEFVTAEPK
jgi:small subunit ribosomal protein S16